VRGLEILSLFSHKNASLNLSEIAEVMGLTSSAVYRYVVTLEHEGYLIRQTGSKQYQLASRVMELGFRYIQSLDIPEIAELFIKELRNKTDFTAHVSILENTDIIYVYRALSDKSMVSNIPVGNRLPAHATSMGRIMLSGLTNKEIRQLYKGYSFPKFTEHTPKNTKTLLELLALDRQRQYVAERSHIAPGTFTIAAPLINSSGCIISAINISGHEQDLEPTAYMIEAVQSAANSISAYL
jgi:IclR family pca regulon transcriptional regulator